ncbi:hypothetical protein GCM10027416_16730 [Okibacterium endophyticum]
MTQHTSHTARRRFAASSLMAAGVVASALLAVSPANAATSANDSPTGESCWQNVDTGESGCFDSSLDPIEQIELATGKPLVANQTETETSFAARAVEENFLLVTGWDATGFEGESVSYFTETPNLCSVGAQNIASLGAWNDRIESFQSFNGCESKFFQNVLFAGGSFGPAASSSNMGTFNNQASSLIVS